MILNIERNEQKFTNLRQNHIKVKTFQYIQKHLLKQLF